MRIRWRSESGQSLGPEMMIILVFALAAWGFLAWLGRLNSTSQDITNTAQAAARAASIEADPGAGRSAAIRAVSGSNLPEPCADTPSVSMSWTAGEDGDWLGGAVTVTVSCTIGNKEAFAGAGRRVSATDVQVIDPFQVRG